jgi:hypothetical protein
MKSKTRWSNECWNTCRTCLWFKVLFLSFLEGLSKITKNYPFYFPWARFEPSTYRMKLRHLCAVWFGTPDSGTRVQQGLEYSRKFILGNIETEWPDAQNVPLQVEENQSEYWPPLRLTVDLEKWVEFSSLRAHHNLSYQTTLKLLLAWKLRTTKDLAVISSTRQVTLASFEQQNGAWSSPPELGLHFSNFNFESRCSKL